MGYSIRKIDNIPSTTLETKQLGWLLHCTLATQFKKDLERELVESNGKILNSLMKNNPKGWLHAKERLFILLKFLENRTREIDSKEGLCH